MLTELALIVLVQRLLLLVLIYLSEPVQAVVRDV